MKNIFKILLFLFLSLNFYVNGITLQWSENKVISFGNDSVEVLSFEGAEYTDASFLPYYFYKENISDSEAKNYEYSFSLTNIIYSEINPNISINYEFISSDFQIDGAVTAASRDYTLEAYILPFKIVENQLYRLKSFDIKIDKKRKISLRSTSTSWFADKSVLASGNWNKIAVNEDGIYKLTYDQLKSMGVDPTNVSVFTKTAGMEPGLIANYVDDLKEIPIYDGGSYILFYGQGTTTWKYNSVIDRFEHDQHLFWNENYYYITSDAGEAKRISQSIKSTDTATKEYTSYVDYDYYEPDEYNIARSGREWFSKPVLSGNKISHTLSFTNALSTDAKATVRVLGQSVKNDNFLTIKVNGQQKDRITLQESGSSSTKNIANYTIKSYTFTPTGNDVNIEMLYSCNENLAKGYIDYFTIEGISDLKLNNNFLFFRNRATDDEFVSYKIKNTFANTQIWDVSNIYDVKKMPISFSNGISTFKSEGNKIIEYAAVNVDANDFKSPKIIGKANNQNLHGIKVPEMVILTHKDFISVAEKLANIHKMRDNMDVFIVTQEEIFNEFSGGKADVTAIRWFMKMLYDRSADTDKFKYLLLLGDGSYNNRMYEVGKPNVVQPSKIMTYQSIESIYGASTYVSDDYFGLLDDNEGNTNIISTTTGETNIDKYDKVDIGIGRIPINTIQEGEDVVFKIDTYLSNKKRGTWKNRVCLVADDEDNNIHAVDADKLAEKIRIENPNLGVKKIFIDAFQQIKESNGHSYPDAKKLSNQYLDEGVLIWNYTGHGNPTSLSGEKMMYISDIMNMNNLSNLPVWVTATCDFCPYDHNDELSAGETVLLNPLGGGVALFTTTRLVYSSSNYQISKNFYSYIFNSDSQGKKLKIGDVTKLTKQVTGTGANKRKFVLIGDPALHLIHADVTREIITDSINGQDISVFTDTLQSLSEMTISGYIAKTDGSVDTDFNGTLYPIVYDKISNITTLDNDNDGVTMDFEMWNSLLFSGKTEVKNGRYTFSFILPKDMDYTSGKGRIEYYATSENIEVNGHYEDFYLGGFKENFTSDNQGPEIKMYMNTPSFSNGDEVNTSPMLIANISDDSGINTSGNSIGHDITIKLNNDPNTIETINSSYTTAIGDYTKGTVLYSLKDLKEGEYTLTLKVWDIQNNSSSSDVKFVVKNDAIPDIESVYCYPNPVSISSGKDVTFVLAHDRPEKTLTVNLHIFDISGRMIYHSSDYSYSQSNELYFNWNPSEEYISPGLYLYSISIDDGNKVSSVKSEKLMLID